MSGREPRDDAEAIICAVGVKHCLNIHPAIARDIAAALAANKQMDGLKFRRIAGQGIEVMAKFLDEFPDQYITFRASGDFGVLVIGLEEPEEKADDHCEDPQPRDGF